MKKILLAVVSLTLGSLIMAAPALAAGTQGSNRGDFTSHSLMPTSGPSSWYAAPMFVYTGKDKDRLSKKAHGGTLRVGKIVNDYFNLEASLSGSHYYKDAERWDTFSAGVHGLVFFFRGKRFHPDLLVSPFADLGAQYVRSRASLPGGHYRYHNDPAFNFDLGATVRLNDYGAKLRFEGGYLWTFYSTGGAGQLVFAEPQAMIGLQIPFGAQ